MANSYLNRTVTSAESPTKITWSVWVKRTTLGASQQIFTKKEGSGSAEGNDGKDVVPEYEAVDYDLENDFDDSESDFLIRGFKKLILKIVV